MIPGELFEFVVKFHGREAKTAEDSFGKLVGSSSFNGKADVDGEVRKLTEHDLKQDS